jgi:hypothetical protein
MPLLQGKASEKLDRVLSAREERFDKLLEIAGLDPARDLRFADLRDVDFVGSMLVGWDFTGADLRGASFRGARVSKCVFTDAKGVDLTGVIEPGNLTFESSEDSKAVVSGLRKLCYVLDAFGQPGSLERQHADSVFGLLVQPVLESHFKDFEIRRFGQISSVDLVDTQVINQLFESDLVIADLSYLTANVFYQLGMRHTIQKPIIHLVKEGERIPFDIRLLRAISFSLTSAGRLRQAQEQLRTSLNEACSENYRGMSPVTMARPNLQYDNYADMDNLRSKGKSPSDAGVFLRFRNIVRKMIPGSRDVEGVQIRVFQNTKEFLGFRNKIVSELRDNAIEHPIYCSSHLRLFSTPDGHSARDREVVAYLNRQLFRYIAQMALMPGTRGGLRLLLQYREGNQQLLENELNEIADTFSAVAAETRSTWNWYHFDIRRLLHDSAKDYFVIEDHVFKTIRKTDESRSEAQFIYIKSPQIASTYREWLRDIFEYGDGPKNPTPYTELGDLRELLYRAKQTSRGG